MVSVGFPGDGVDVAMAIFVFVFILVVVFVVGVRFGSVLLCAVGSLGVGFGGVPLKEVLVAKGFVALGAHEIVFA